jgi:hypothetical protein
MKRETILRHIDNNIITNLSSKDFDGTREVLYSTARRFKDRLDKDNLNLEMFEIEKISDTRQRYTSIYIFFSEKRIIDLYKIERMQLSESPLMAYKMLLFKEKLEKCESRPFIYNKKYITYTM